MWKQVILTPGLYVKLEVRSIESGEVLFSGEVRLPGGHALGL